MRYTLKDYLDSSIAPKNIKLLTNKQDFDQIEVLSSSVQEMPVYDFIQPGEIILSVGQGCREDPNLFYDLIKISHESKAACIFFAFQKPLMIPKKTIDYANSINFPIFEIPWEYPFSKLQMDIMQKVYESAQAEYIQLQNELYDMYSSSKPIEIALKKIASFLDAEIVIKNEFDDIIYGNQGINTTHEIPIKLGAINFGYLCILNQEFNEADLKLIHKYLVFPLSLWMNQDTIEGLTALRLKNDYIHNLINKNYASLDNIIQQGYRLGFELSGPHLCIVMKAIILDLDQDPIELSNCAIDIEKKLLHAARKLELKPMISNSDLEFIIFIKPHNEYIVKNYIDICLKLLTNVDLHFEYYWGYSELSLETPDYTLLYDHALLALHYGLADKRHIYYFKDTKKALITSILSQNQNILDAIDEILEPLIIYDEHSQTYLLETLITYIQSNYNISQTARNLHIHRQSLLYRLEKIESLAKLSLNDHDDLYVLESLCRVYHPF